MKQFSEYISESVAGRRKLPRMRYTEFPRDRKDAKAIEMWLEDNHFVELRGGGGGPASDTTLFGYDIDCYTRGSYDKYNIGTWWYKIWDGEMLICIRTCDDVYFNKRRLKPVEAYDSRDYPIDMSYSDVVEYFDNKLTK
jgi:hypothetical protein